MVGKGLLGQYAGFISRAVGFVLDLLIVIAIIWIVNFAITLPLEYFLDFNINRCPALVGSEFNLRDVKGEWLCVAVIATQTILSLLVGPAYFILLWSMGGQTVGQYVSGVRVVRLDGRKMNFMRSLVRYLGYFVSALALGLGYLWVLWDDRRQGFHDKMARTAVVYAWEARQNEFLLDRIRRKLGGKAEAAGHELTADELRNLRFVVVDFKQHSQLNSALSSLEDLVRRGELAVVSVVVLVKDEEGQLGLVGVSDFSLSGAAPMPLAKEDYTTVKHGLERLLQHYPTESFVMAILVNRNTVRSLSEALERLNVGFDVFEMNAVIAAVREVEEASHIEGKTPEPA